MAGEMPVIPQSMAAPISAISSSREYDSEPNVFSCSILPVRCAKQWPVECVSSWKSVGVEKPSAELKFPTRGVLACRQNP